MVFEETLIFYNPLDADNFSKKLREEGSRTKTRIVKTLVKETICKAEIKKFREFFLEESDNFSDDESEISGLLRETYSMVIAEFESMESNLKEYLDSKEEGACLSDDPETGSFLDTLKEEGGLSKLRDLAIEGDEFASKMMRIIPVLEENGMIEEKDAKKYLLKSKDAEELVTSMPSDILLEGSSQESRKKFSIKTVVNVMSGNEYHVTTPPEFAFKTDLNDLDLLVSGYNVEEDSYTRLKENIFIKTLIAGRIIDFLKDREKSSGDEITEEIKNVTISVKETGDEFVFDLEKEYINEVLADMKKLDIIKGKGNRFRF